MNPIYDEPYPSFEERRDRLDLPWSTLPSEVPLVDPDKAFPAKTCIWAFVAFLVFFFGLVAWPDRP